MCSCRGFSSGWSSRFVALGWFESSQIDRVRRVPCLGHQQSVSRNTQYIRAPFFLGFVENNLGNLKTNFAAFLSHILLCQSNEPLIYPLRGLQQQTKCSSPIEPFTGCLGKKDSTSGLPYERHCDEIGHRVLSLGTSGHRSTQSTTTTAPPTRADFCGRLRPKAESVWGLDALCALVSSSMACLARVRSHRSFLGFVKSNEPRTFGGASFS